MGSFAWGVVDPGCLVRRIAASELPEPTIPSGFISSVTHSHKAANNRDSWKWEVVEIHREIRNSSYDLKSYEGRTLMKPSGKQ